MQKNISPCYYSDYLHLDQLLDSQRPVSRQYQDEEAHDEMLFIIVHQAYELWFKQVLHELKSVIRIFQQPVLDARNYGRIIQRLGRVNKIQKLLNQQIGILETMTPLDFLEFRDYLIPASGFQSTQFKEIEILLGLKMADRISFDRAAICKRLNRKDLERLRRLEEQPGLFDFLQDWLERMPFLDQDYFSFIDVYKEAVSTMLANDQLTIEGSEHLSEKDREMHIRELEQTRRQFAAIFDAASFSKLAGEGQFRMSRTSLMAAIFINLYRDEPAFQQPYLILEKLVDIDEEYTQWRYRHAVMVQRMLGSKMGTGGSSGHDYLKQTTRNNRFFSDLSNLSTFLIPRSSLPELPLKMKKTMGLVSQ